MKSFIKNNIKFIIVIVICLIGSSITTLATNYIFNSNEVSYDNSESGLHADSVQGAIDEVFQHATDYSDIKTTIGTGSLTTTNKTLIGGVNELNGKLTSKLDKTSVYNGLNSTVAGYALDALQGKALNESLNGFRTYTHIFNLSQEAAVNLLVVAQNLVDDATERTFYIEDGTRIVNYPSAMTTVDAVIRVFYTVRRLSQRLMVTIKAVNGVGTVYSIDGFAYTTSNDFTWGSVY